MVRNVTLRRRPIWMQIKKQWCCRLSFGGGGTAERWLCRNIFGASGAGGFPLGALGTKLKIFLLFLEFKSITISYWPLVFHQTKSIETEIRRSNFYLVQPA